VTVLVWRAACRPACSPACRMHEAENSHINSWRYAARHFSMFRITLTNHGLEADKWGLLPIAKYVMVRHQSLSRTKVVRHLVSSLTTTCSTRDNKSSNVCCNADSQIILKCRLIGISQIANQRRIRSTNWSHLYPWFHPPTQFSFYAVVAETELYQQSSEILHRQRMLLLRHRF